MTEPLKTAAGRGAAALALLFLAAPARAQSPEEGRAWIHANGRDCCPHQFCKPVGADPGVTFWIVWGHRSAVRMGEERRWPFAQTWGCAYPHDPETIRCLFVPPQEQS